MYSKIIKIQDEKDILSNFQNLTKKLFQLGKGLSFKHIDFSDKLEYNGLRGELLC